MTTNEDKNIVTLLAVNKAYNYFIPNLNNVTMEKKEELNINNDEIPNANIKIDYNKKKLSFIKYLRIENVKPHCNCEKDELGRCKRMLNWIKISKTNELSLDGIYNELINVIEFITRIENNKNIEINLNENGIMNRLFNNRIMNSIYMDVCRTYPSISYFKEEGKSYLSKILLIYSLMDIDVGYVQGMNFLVGCILWHSHSEESAFQLLVSLMFNYGMREMFISGLPGLRTKCKILDYLMEKNLHDIWEHIIKQGGTIDMLATDWFLTLFSYSIPLNIIGLFWDDFFQQGWIPLYKLILYRLQRINNNILSSNDIADIMNAIKYSMPSSKNGIFGNAILNIKDEISKTNFGRFFNHFNSLFTNNHSNDNNNNNLNINQNEINHNPQIFTNDPNIISLPHVWNDLILEAQYEVELDVNLIEQLEYKFNLNCNIESSYIHNHIPSFEFYNDNQEVREKEEQYEENLSKDQFDIRIISNNHQYDDYDNTKFLQQSHINETVEKYRQYYSDIIHDIFDNHLNNNINQIKYKLQSLFDKLLIITENLLIRSSKKDHLREIKINSIEAQKHKFGPWAYSH